MHLPLAQDAAKARAPQRLARSGCVGFAVAAAKGTGPPIWRAAGRAPLRWLRRLAQRLQVATDLREGVTAMSRPSTKQNVTFVCEPTWGGPRASVEKGAFVVPLGFSF